jgi:HlyD family secretion protein
MAKTRSKKKIIIITILVAAGIGTAVFATLKKREPPISIETEKVVRRNLVEKVVANGKIEPVLQVKISPEVSGEIIDLGVKEGQHVGKGDLLVRIKPDNYLAASNSAAASYKLSVANRSTSEANLEKARLEYERSAGLYKAKLISDSDYLTAKTTYDVSKTTLAGAVESVAMAEASLQSAASDLSKTTIYSPLDGTVSKLNSQKGERVVGTAMMAGTEIMIIADLNAMEARVDVGEVDVVLISVGQKVHLEADSFKDRKFNGTVTDVANSANNNDTSSVASASTSTTTDATKFQVKIRVSEKEDFLPGMSVTANIETRSRTNALSVPIQSVTTRLPKPAPGQTNSPQAGATNAPGKTNASLAAATNSPGKTNASLADATNAPGTTNAPLAEATNAPGKTNAPLAEATNAAPSNPTNDAKSSGKLGEPPKPIDVVFLLEGDHVKMAAVKCGISDDNYTEITEGLHEGDTVVSGGYKAINRDLEDGKKAVVGGPAGAKPKAAAN